MPFEADHQKYVGCFALKSDKGADYLGYVRKSDEQIAVYYISGKFVGMVDGQKPNCSEKTNSSNEIAGLKKRLAKIDGKLEAVRGASPLTHGWQTQRLARAARTWDVLAAEKTRIRGRLAELGVEI